ncbi:hypothetical protein BCR34DRAFT_586149 [Clohesyomyces aquaticus]|uniref:Uncharacterized protein n=1 Tax=Clohesyomyces aquaticus TaxID=1231657 RepID=A0A1Y1ZUL1_9PLEO|nr:hypothetical protein BCR34DRAFT_586149 [Clohesyomyces aquaticus]
MCSDVAGGQQPSSGAPRNDPCSVRRRWVKHHEALCPPNSARNPSISPQPSPGDRLSSVLLFLCFKRLLVKKPTSCRTRYGPPGDRPVAGLATQEAKSLPGTATGGSKSPTTRSNEDTATKRDTHLPTAPSASTPTGLLNEEIVPLHFISLMMKTSRSRPQPRRPRVPSVSRHGDFVRHRGHDY